MLKSFSIAIDGPVAAGKGTIAIELTNELNGFYLYTGAMYRSVALFCIENGIDVESENAVAQIMPNIDIDFVDGRISLNGRDIAERIKQADTAKGSSVVAQYKLVREDLVRKQQEIVKKALGRGQIVIADGRDIGTKVIPNANIKIFLTASVEARVEREIGRYKKQGIVKDKDIIREEIKSRDARDTNREIDPLPSNPLELGYWVLDNSNQTERETIDIIIEELKKKGLIDDQN